MENNDQLFYQESQMFCVKLARSTCREHTSLHARLSHAEEHLSVIDFSLKSFIENKDQLYYQKKKLKRVQRRNTESSRPRYLAYGTNIAAGTRTPDSF